MNTSKTTLDHFFGIDASSEDWVNEITAKKDFESFKTQISEKLKGVPVPGNIAVLVLEQILDLLQIDVRAILAKAWSENEIFQKYLNPDAYPPGEDVQVSLAEHTIVSEHSPSLQPVINGISAGEIQFHIALTLALKGASLNIQDGRIMEMAIGSCEGGGVVSFGDFTILEKEKASWDLPGSINLGEGIPIRDYSEELQGIMAGLDTQVEDASAEGV